MKTPKDLSPEEITEINKRNFEESRRQFLEFRDKFSKGICPICDSPNDYFDKSAPCMHWLLVPQGFKKKYFELITQKFSYSRMNSYLRWVANQETPLKNINDFAEERSESKIIETTIHFENKEWSFSCGKLDFEGHPRSQFNFPHYHFGMSLDGRPIIKFSDFHLPLSEEDIFDIKAQRGEIPGVMYGDYFGASAEGIMNILTPKELLDSMISTSTEGSEVFHISNMVEAAPGKTISGDDIADLMEESKRTGVPLAKLLGKLKDVKVQSIISPGDDIPNIIKRKKR